MAKIIVALLMVTLATVPTQSAESRALANDPVIPGVCAVGRNLYPEGSTWYLKHCVRAHCSRTGTTMLVTYQSCGHVGTLPNCKMVSDNTKIYPDCCPTSVCPK
ncbi:venom toxin OcyC11-like isoform X1 [Penaeus japonicus]|uniref:venom toxin OcyC11-like isoform X1 n=1 Tax=Penaeus japonicus TaxID=27405 RepID=UPI001C710A80|nr:venom toxin OcyC11-like isoform X1 [Penaeus japonicus]